MGSIPVDIQRRFEQRWAAKFLQQPPSSKPLEKNQLADQGASGKSKTERAGNSQRVLPPVEVLDASPHRPCFG
jgi:hypothetical protein